MNEHSFVEVMSVLELTVCSEKTPNARRNDVPC